MKHFILKPQPFLLAFALMLSFHALGQTITGSTVITPVCSSSNGTLQLTSSGTFPFTITWYGSGIQNGSATITSATQNITLIPNSNNSFGRGFTVYIFGPSQNYLGNFEAGMNYDLPSNLISPSCTSPGTFSVTNIRNGTAPYTINLVDASNNVLVSGSSPLSVPFSSVCPVNNQVRVGIVDANGCANIPGDSFIRVLCNGLNVSLNSTTASCTNGTATVASVTGNTGSISYSWSNGATTSSISSLRTGTYSCIVTDATNCSGMGSAFVPQSIFIGGNVSTKVATCNNFDGQATAFGSGGNSPYTYNWSNGSSGQTITNLQTGSHNVVIEDANQCIGRAYFYLGSVSPVNVTYTTTPSSCTSSTGSATLTISGGQTPYSITWTGQSSTANTINNLPPGEHSFNVTDANGCTFNGRVVIPPISTIIANVGFTSPVCPNNNGSITIAASSSAGAVTYLWNTSATTSSLSNLAPGNYSCTIRDGNNCTLVKNIYLEQKSTVKLNFNTTNASCIFNADGSATAFATGGTSPYTYRWSDGSTSQTISNKKEGVYFAGATDANGCRTDRFKKVTIGYNPSNNSCYCEIKGRVYDDLDSNCTFGSGENGIYNAAVYFSGIGSTTTDYNGNYSIKVPAGTYTVTELPLYSSKLSPCQTNPQSITFSTTGSGCNQVFDFGNIIIPYHDIITFPIQRGAPVPGRNYTQYIVVHNGSNRAENAIDATLFNDGKLSLSGFSPSMTSIGGNHYKPSSPISIARGARKILTFDYFTPTNLPLGALVYFRDSVAYQSPISSAWINNEASPWNNISEYFNIVRSSYDPNQKNVYPQGEGEEGKIKLEQKDFLYVIQFENNGTANADKVVIIDSLDNDFDFSSFRTIDASHGVRAFISETGVITFTFDRINLAYTPKGVNNPLAQGYVAFKIKAKSTVKLGDKLQNFSDIYFDYNDPVRTNTTLNTYANDVTDVKDVLTGKNEFILYPNPNQGQMQVIIPHEFGSMAQLEIYNTQGQLIQQIAEYSTGNTINTGNLSVGIYFIKVMTENGHIEFLRFIKQ